ncbi:MAG TPA: thioredoxin domain-containing protein, partial [Polyangiaceae bacterium]|nr:thioredoxin domain-containing protein [Polyangiaceae bacterium]
MQPVPRRSWLGVLAVVLGAVTMVGGGVAVVVAARRLPPAAPMGPVPVPPPVVPAPALPPAGPTLLPSTPSPSDGAPSDSSTPARPVFSPPVPTVPFADDAAAPVPVEGGHPLWGNRDAPVTLTLFVDLECPHSIAFLREVLRLKARRGDDVRVAFRHRPLSQHHEAEIAARALAEIHATRGEQAFWHALGAIARRGETLEPGALEIALDAAGLTGFPLPSPVARAEAALAADAELAVALFVRDTPTLFVNGRRFSGYLPRAALEEAVDRELRAADLSLATGVPPARLYTERTRKNFLNLGDDPPARECVPVGDSPVLGPANAAVTLVEFTDLECELCRQGEAALASALKSAGSDVRVVWKNFPLPQHHRARLAAGVALAARSAAGDRAFWGATRALFEPRSLLDDEALTQALLRGGFDAAALLEASKAGSYEVSIDADVRLADKLGVSGAPTYFLNGRKLPGALPAAEFQALIAKERELARRVRAQGGGNVAELSCGVRSPSAKTA